VATRGFEDRSPRSVLRGIGNFLLDRSKAFDKDFHKDKEFEVEFDHPATVRA